MKFVLLFAFTLGVSAGGHLPSDWQSCKGSSNLSSCFKSAIEDALVKLKNGLSDLGIPRLEPLTIPSATIGEGTGAVNVVQHFKNFQVFGISNGKLSELTATRTPNGLSMQGVSFLSEVKMVADYTLDGRVLLLPIVGSGKCQVILNDLNAKFTLDLSKIEKKGVEYLNTTLYKVEFTPGKVTYNFENLFNGDARLGSELNKLLNDNWKIVFDDVKSGYEKVYEIIFADYTNKVFSNIPYSEIL